MTNQANTIKKEADGTFAGYATQTQNIGSRRKPQLVPVQRAHFFHDFEAETQEGRSFAASPWFAAMTAN